MRQTAVMSTRWSCSRWKTISEIYLEVAVLSVLPSQWENLKMFTLVEKRGCKTANDRLPFLSWSRKSVKMLSENSRTHLARDFLGIRTKIPPEMENSVRPSKFVTVFEVDMGIRKNLEAAMASFGDVASIPRTLRFFLLCNSTNGA